MSLKLDLLLEAIEKLDRCEANDEVLSESIIKFKDAKKHSTEWDNYMCGGYSKEEGKNYMINI